MSALDLSRVVWKKSTRSGNSGCVEVAKVDGQIAVRDSKNPTGPALIFSDGEWASFVGAVKADEFDL